MSDVPRITYIPHPNTTADRESEILATVYAFILECQAKRKADEVAKARAHLHKEGRPPCKGDD
jgi:hypothetical protein